MTPLQAPSQAAPSGVAVTASSVSSPNSAPNVPTTTASSVTSPNASVSSPSVSSVSSPSSSSASVVSSVTPPVSSKPVGSVTVKPLGRYNPVTGKCENAAWVSEECDTDKDLKSETERLELEQRSSTGSRADEIKARLLEIELQRSLREKAPNDKAGDRPLRNILGSGMYQGDFDLKNNASVRISFLTNLIDQVKSNSMSMKEVGGLGNFMQNYRIGVDDAGRPYFFFTGSGFSDFDTSSLTTYQWDSKSGNVPIIYFNGNSSILNSIFGGSNSSKIIGLLASSINGLKSPRGGHGSSPRVARTNYSYTDFRRESHGGFNGITRQSNPCDVGLNAPSSVSRQNPISFQEARVLNQTVGFTESFFSNYAYFYASFGNDKQYDIPGEKNEDFRNFFYGVSFSDLDLDYGTIIRISAIASYYDWEGNGVPGFGSYGSNNSITSNKGVDYTNAFLGVRGSRFAYEDPADLYWMRRGWEYAQAGCK